MDKESIYQLQKLDCNCSDCAYMVRDMDKFRQSEALHHKWQLDYFKVLQDKQKKAAKMWLDLEYDLEKWDRLLTLAENMRFQFDRNECKINYGDCSKFNKPVSFISGTLQLDTQQCFVHRKDKPADPI